MINALMQLSKLSKKGYFDYSFICRCGNTHRRHHGDMITIDGEIRYIEHHCRYCKAKYRVTSYIHYDGVLHKRISVWAIVMDKVILSQRLEEFGAIAELFKKRKYLYRISESTVIIENSFSSDVDYRKWRALYDYCNNF